MKILILLSCSVSSMIGYPLFVSSGHTNHPKVQEMVGITGPIKVGDILPPTDTKLFAINNATLIVTNQEKPNQRITIIIKRLLPPPPGSKITEPPSGNVRILPDSVSFIGVEGTYQIEETGKNQWDQSTATVPPSPTPPAMVAKGTAQAGTIKK